MATPTRSQGVSHPLTSTPNRPTASPRPGTGYLQNRPIAHKSPAVKTPSSSAHGHSHRISISSQPTSTPLAAPAIQEELLNLNSPAAALIASIGRTGLTPLPSGHDGLGITSGITPMPTQDLTLHRTPELERLHRLQQISQLLETRSLGRGVTRKGVIALAQREKFDQVWDGDTVNIAGVSVDLEIAFASDDKDVIHDAILNLVTDDGGDPQPQESASAMLKRQLVAGDAESEGQPWNNLDHFAANLHYLSHHDRLECPANAFKLVGSLYHTFQKIWTEEKKRMKDRHEALHLCRSNVGKPAMDIGTKLGLVTTYWKERHEFLAAANSEVGTPDSQSEDWSARFVLSVGEPSISSDQNWLGEEALSSSVSTESVFQDGPTDRPNWREIDLGANEGVPVKEEGADAMDLDNPQLKIPKSLGVQFVAVFEPSVLVPINVLTELNTASQMLQVNQNDVTTVQQALQAEYERLHGASDVSEGRWNTTLSFADKSAKASSRNFAYMLYASDGAWSYPVSQLSFSHPRQFAEAVPILRQYTLLWSLLRRTTTGSLKPPEKKNLQAKAAITAGKGRNGVTKRSNKKAAQVQLEQLLSGKRDPDQALNIDISLDLTSDMTLAKLDVLIPIRGHSFAQVKIVVRRDGVLDVVSVTGMSTQDEVKLKSQATRVLKLSEDIGVLGQWLLGQVQKPT